MITLKGVSFAYGAGVAVLDRVDFHLGAGLTLLLGPNGCGKSTLMKVMAGVESPDAGSVVVCGRELWREEAAGRMPIAYLPEYPDLTPYASVLEILRLVCRLRREPVERADDALAAAGLALRSGASVRELSAGERRRAMLAAAWIGRPRVALLDEPLETLDRSLRDRVLEWVLGMTAEGAAVVVVTHEIEPFVGMAVRAVSLSQGRAVVVDPLPGEPAERLSLIDRLARCDDLPPTAWRAPGTTVE